ncbi:hypothetical protein CBL_08652 [Carabus blaptoides fortunei]
MQFRISSVFFVVALVMVCMSAVLARPSDGDLDTAASGHEGRVQIKVYRGATEHDGHEHFAPWGFWYTWSADHYRRLGGRIQLIEKALNTRKAPKDNKNQMCHLEAPI